MFVFLSKWNKVSHNQYYISIWILTCDDLSIRFTYLSIIFAICLWAISCFCTAACFCSRFCICSARLFLKEKSKKSLMKLDSYAISASFRAFSSARRAFSCWSSSALRAFSCWSSSALRAFSCWSSSALRAFSCWSSSAFRAFSSARRAFSCWSSSALRAFSCWSSSALFNRTKNWEQKMIYYR